MNGFGTGMQGGYAITWKHIAELEPVPATPPTNAGARYLPSGQLVEWELDADGKPMKITVDGESVPAEFLSGAKRITIDEMVRFNTGRRVMCFRYCARDESGTVIDTYEDELDDVHLRVDQREAIGRFNRTRTGSIRELYKQVRAKFPGTKFNESRSDLAAEDELRRCVAEGASGANANYYHGIDDVEIRPPTINSKLMWGRAIQDAIEAVNKQGKP